MKETLMSEAPWEDLRELLARQDVEGAREFVEHLGADEQRRVVSRLDHAQREALLELLGADEAGGLMATSVIAAFEGTVQAVIALAVFLPIVSDMCGFFLVLSLASACLAQLG